jgi:hypothetical protein
MSDNFTTTDADSACQAIAEHARAASEHPTHEALSQADAGKLLLEWQV